MFACNSSLADNTLSQHINVLTLGDSYTVGTGLARHESWPYLLKSTLDNANLSVGEPVNNTTSTIHVLATNGWTSGNLLHHFETQLEQGQLQTHYDWITIMIGSNDHFQDAPVATFEQNLETLLQKITPLIANNQRIILMTNPDWRLSPAGRRMLNPNSTITLQPFNAAIKKLADKYVTQLIDIEPLVISAYGQDNAYVTDGLHFTSAVYQQWADAIHQIIHPEAIPLTSPHDGVR